MGILQDSKLAARQFEIDSEYDDLDWSQVHSVPPLTAELCDFVHVETWRRVEAGFTEAADGGDEDQDEGFSSPEKVPLVWLPREDEMKHTPRAGPWTVLQDGKASPIEVQGAESLQGLPVVLLAEIRRFVSADDEFEKLGGASRVMSQATVAAMILDELCTSCCGVVQPALGEVNVGQLCTFTKLFQGTDRGTAEKEDILQVAAAEFATEHQEGGPRHARRDPQRPPYEYETRTYETMSRPSL
ncbi:unnamed protein product [Symbiodinium sp. CCMP2592]|nr:unnamed protein product [Symbiodinium sp. CCMP2592]